ncbi:polyprenyl synthetase family protein [Actinoallomurus sp. CA-142502]|uniref:polyprenyl synthetase family protein n=1 Tax=Actinoallomurus sp. CA-142502 TaxID=3239885 RepID=UPI003D8EF497
MSTADVATRMAEMAGWFNERFSRLVTKELGLPEQAREVILPGRRTRVIGCLLACQAAGGEPDRAFPFAASIEFMHKASVVRDDIVDDDKYRDGFPTLHERIGIDSAITISDLLLSAALQLVMAEYGGGSKRTLCTLIVEAYRRMAMGQFRDAMPDAAAPGMPQAAVEFALETNNMKTASLVSTAFRGGAICGGAQSETADALARFGSSIGDALQLLNDVGNLVGAVQHRSRRQVTNTDLRNQRNNILVAMARSAAAYHIRARMNDLLTQTSPLAESSIRELRSLILASGAHKRAEAMAEAFIEDAKDALRDVSSSEAKDILLNLCDLSTLSALVL